MKNNVSFVYSGNLCCSCGLCSNYCTKDAISYKVDSLGLYRPVVDASKCINCGACVRNCPGINDLKNRTPQPETYCYGYSNDHEMHLNAASGGLTTELLCYLLEHNIVDYVTVVTNRTADSKPQQILTNDVRVVRECRTSKYCPISRDHILRDIEQCNGSVAFMGLPCQVNSVRKYYSKRKNCNIKFYFSLLCHHTPSLRATDFLVESIGPYENLDHITYRGGGFPGHMTVHTQSGGIYHFPYRQTWAAGYGKYFKNRRCELCNDGFSSNADIVMGDSYFLQDTDTEGTTFAIIRKPELSDILHQMASDGIITLNDGPSTEVQNCYYAVFHWRSQYFAYKNAMLRKLHCLSVRSEEVFPGRVGYRESLAFYRTLQAQSLGRFHFLWKRLIKNSNLKTITQKIK